MVAKRIPASSELRLKICSKDRVLGGSGQNQAAHRGDYPKKLIPQEQFGVKMKFYVKYGIDDQPHRKNQLVLSSFLSKEKVRIREYDFKNGSNPAHFFEKSLNISLKLFISQKKCSQTFFSRRIEFFKNFFFCKCSSRWREK